MQLSSEQLHQSRNLKKIGPCPYFDLSWVVITWLDMSRLDLSWLDFSLLDLSWLNLSWHDLSWLDLSWLDLCCLDHPWLDLSWPDLARANKPNFSFLGYIEHWFQVLHEVAGWSHLNNNATLWPKLRVRTCQNSVWLPSWAECGNEKKKKPHQDLPEGSVLQT